MTRSNNLKIAVACALAGGLGMPLLAQSARADEAAAPTTQLDEVVVTARKREERLKDVPIAVTVVTGDLLEREQIQSIRGVAEFTPGLIINHDAVGRAFVSIRGIGTTLIDTVQPGVGIFIDGIYMPNTSYLNNPVLDVDHIEVLKGPQGTLFGNNTLGGAINVITRKPGDVAEGSVSADYADPDNYETVSGSLSGPLVQGTLRGRIAASYHSQDGFSKNLLAGGNARPLENRAANTTLIWDPTDGVSFTLNGYYSSVKGGITAYSNPSGPTDYLQNVTLNLNSIAEYVYTGGNLKGEFDLPGVNTTLTTILSYDDKDGTAAGDGDYGPVDFARVHGGHNTLKTRTAELRFATKWSDATNSLLGFFYTKSDGTNFFYTDLPLFGLSNIPNSQRSGQTSSAVFTNVIWDLSDALELSAGLRYDHQEVTSENVLASLHAKYTADEWEPRVTLTKHWSPTSMTYASISKGFRGGGTNVPGAPNPIYKGDSVWAYEIGHKMTGPDGALTLNTSIYYNDYRNYIGQNALYPVGSTFIAINLNSGDVTSYGAELEGAWQATERFSLQAGLSLNHARITNGSEYEQTVGVPLATDRILFVPDWTYSLLGSYNLPISDGSSLRFDATFIGKGSRVGSTLSPTYYPVLAPYNQINANITWTHNNWSVALWGTNLTDKIYFESYLDKSLLSAGGFTGPLVNNLGITSDGRRIGLRVSAKF